MGALRAGWSVSGAVPRIVIDTSALVSALLFRGAATALAALWKERRVRLVASRSMLREYAQVLAYPKFGLDAAVVEAILREHVLPFCDDVEPVDLPLVCRDPTDDPFLACAVAARADALVTGDRDLLAVGAEYEGIPILTVRDAIERFSQDRASA